MHKRLFGLDILRCAAIMFVVLFHVLPIFRINWDAKFPRLFFIDGVNLFFVLSGYLIGGILIKDVVNKGASIRTMLQFWKNRWWRTLPAYFSVLAIIGIALYCKGELHAEKFYKYALFIQNIKTGSMPYFGESWSLAVEEWFYLLSAPAIFLMSRLFGLKRAIPIVVICLILISNVLRIYKVHHYGIVTYMQYILDVELTVPTRLDSLIFGVLGAYLAFHYKDLWLKYKEWSFYLGISLLIANNIYMYIDQVMFYTFYMHLTVASVATLLLLPKLSTIKSANGMVPRIISHIAITSYSIYLMHGSIFNLLIEPYVAHNKFIHLVVYLVFAFLGGYISYLTIEKWSLRQRAKYDNKKMEPKVLQLDLKVAKK